MAEDTRLQVLESGTDLDALVALGEWADEIILGYAWINSNGGSAAHWQALPLAKVRLAVVGADFAQTEPHALETLWRVLDERLRVVSGRRGVFHPKVVVGLAGGTSRAIIGSSNLTSGGFEKNEELNLLVEAPTNSPEMEAIHRRLTTWAEAGDPVTRAWLDRYTRLWRSRPTPVRVPRVSDPEPRDAIAGLVTSEADLTVGWDEYFEKLRQAHDLAVAGSGGIRVFEAAGESIFKPADSYLRESSRCANAWTRGPRFDELPVDARKLIAGCGGGSTGAFGSMRGARQFDTAIVNDAAAIGAALDALPFHGIPALTLVSRVMNDLITIRGVGLTSASRLLAMKRPDLFLCVTNGNKVGITQVFGAFPASLASYIALIRRIWDFAWFRGARPVELEAQRVWDIRVAVMDAFFYRWER